MPDPATELQSLLDRRDLAAYRAVVAIDLVIHFWEAQDYESALASLKRARNDFQEAEARIAEFRKSPQIQKGEPIRHGHRNATA